MSGTLYLVGTPIGNLGDLSVRALETLRSADFIAAEDTRVTAKLLNHFEIRKPCVSYYEHNKYASGEKIVARLLAGETCALVTDAGMPAISDPARTLCASAPSRASTCRSSPAHAPPSPRWPCPACRRSSIASRAFSP